jgi:hypothetical protein
VLSIAGSAIKSDGHLPRIREKLGAMSSGQSFEAPSRVIELTPPGLADLGPEDSLSLEGATRSGSVLTG